MNLTQHIRLAPRVEEAYRRALRHWRWALSTPLIYLLIAEFVVNSQTAGAATAARDWDGPNWRAILFGLAAGAAAALGAGRARRRHHIRRYIDDPAQALRRWTIDFYVMAALADSIALLGFLDAWATGRSWSLFAGGVLSYLGYAAAYPVRSDLAGLDDPLARRTEII